MDLHDIARACRTYGIKKYLLVTPLAQQRDMAKKIAAHWTEGWGSTYNPDRSEAFSTLKIFASVNRALKWVSEREKAKPFTIATTAKPAEGAVHWLSLKRRILEEDLPPVFIFGTGWGLHEDVLKEADSVMTPIAGGTDSWNHLSVRSAVSITLDRFFGWR
jgi:tRNA (guanine37-N1)-methyltransferase